MATSDTTDWNSEAARYDDDPDHGLRDPAVRAAWESLLLPLLPPRPVRVADLGCGTGSLSVLLAEAGHEVSGLDRSEPMLAAAAAKAAAAGLPIRFDRGDAAAPPYAAGSLDVVLVRHVLWAVPDPDAALAAWVGLLAPSGRLILVEGHWHTGGGLRAETTRSLVLRHRQEAEVTMLTDEALWGGPVNDERYLLVSRR